MMGACGWYHSSPSSIGTWTPTKLLEALGRSDKLWELKMALKALRSRQRGRCGPSGVQVCVWPLTGVIAEREHLALGGQGDAR